MGFPAKQPYSKKLIGLKYRDFDLKLQGRNHESKKLANHTYLKRRGENIAVRLHQTDILIFSPDGTIEYNTGGWKTSTTKERMNSYGTLNLWTNRGVWYVGKSWEDKSVVYADGIKVMPDGKITGAGTPPDLKILKRIKKYSNDFVAALFAGKVPAPSGGDCWDCSLKTESRATMGQISHSDHIKSHLKEGYFVPSLLVNATERFQIAPIVKNTIAGYWSGHSAEIGDWERRIAGRDIQKAIYRYVKESLGFQA